MLGRAQNTGTRKRTRERFDINSVTAPAMKKFRRCKETKRGAIIYKDWSPSVVVRRLPASSVEGRCCGKITVEDKRKPQMNTAPKKKCVNPLTSVTSKPQHTSGPLSSGNQKDVVSEITSPVQGPTVDTNHRKSTRLAKMIPNYYGDLVILDDDIEFDDEGITNGVSNKIVKGDDDDDDDDYHGSNHDDDDIDVEGVSDDDDIDVETVSDDDDVETVSDHGNVDHSQVDHSQVDEHHNGIIGRNNDHDNDGDDKDDIIFCEDCHAPYHGDCPVHGPLIPLDESRGWDQDSKSFTSVPVPLQVTVKMSSIMNAGKGVFAKEFIPRRTRIGPYKGEVMQKEDVTDETDTSYFWEISTNSRGSLYMDGNNDVHANWMRHIRCADVDTQYNMLPFQYGGMVYYFTTEDITPSSELLVWHEEQYSTQQGDLLVLCGKELVEEYVSSDDAQKYTCAHCQKEFTDKKKFKNHSRSCRLKAFTCEICGEVLPTQTKLYQHVAKHKDCDSTWAGSSTPKQSKAKPQGKRNVKAKPTLPEEVKDTKELTNSDKSVPNSKLTNDKDGHQPYQCQCCSKTFAAPGTLQQHLMAHVESKPFPCPYCSEAFAHEEWLQLHLQYHARPTPHHCMYCSKACTTVAQLQAHTAMHTREMCQCQYCNRTFMEPSILQAHLWEHAQEKRHQCHYCDKSFTHKGALKAHLTTHKGDKQLRCDYCNKTFTKYNGFQSHLRTHIGDKPNQCQYCGVAFSSISGLWEHVRLHTVNKHYHCQHCGQVFTCSTDLQYHLTLHTSY